MDTTFEILQGLLSAIFSLVGIIKTYPAEILKKLIPWTNRFPFLLVRVIGISELVLGLGLILPMVTHVAPVVTPIAALGLVFIMAFEIFNHLTNKESRVVTIDLLLLVLLSFIAYIRFQH